MTLLTLIRRELLDNLMTFRFAAAVVIMLLLVVANTIVLIKDYEVRLADYNTAVKTHRQELLESKTYSGGVVGWSMMIVDRPPNPLGIFNTGLDKRLGNEIAISHLFIPTIWDAKKHEADNSYFNIFTSIDIVLGHGNRWMPRRLVVFSYAPEVGDQGLTGDVYPI